ncbi:MAG: BON domain-containing protein [Thermoanaerobaculales bacterium]
MRLAHLSRPVAHAFAVVIGVVLALAAPVRAATSTPTPGVATRAGGAIDRAWNAMSDELADAIVKTKIRVAMLEHLKSDGLRVQIDVRAGIVDLSGEVERRANQKLAGQVAASVDGVKELHNRITVATGAQPSPPPVAGFVGKVERGLDDALLQARIKGRLLEELGKVAFKIEVGATDGVVSLSGAVPDEAREKLAVKIAKETSGVKELHDLLKIAP